MVTTRKLPAPERPDAALTRALHRHLGSGQRLVLGLSGGIDSVVLLHALQQYATAHAIPFSCVHVHHGLSARADGWADFCARLCAANAVSLEVHRVTVDRHDPAGIEAAARIARNAVFARLDADYILTAHHQNDQAETLLLQLLRGAGPKGLAAMAERQHHDGWQAVQLRPLLGVTRAAIEDYARAHALSWVEDDSNSDTAYNRNYLRQTLMPLLTRRFPAAVPTLARSAALQADASTLLNEMASLDAQQCVMADRLDCVCLSALSLARARNLLRWFIERQGHRMPSERRLDEGLRQILHAAPDACVRVLLAPGFELRRYRGGAYLVPIQRCAQQSRRPWRGESAVRLTQAGYAVLMTRAHGTGLSAARLEAARVEIGVRRGGERMRLSKTGGHKSLKNLLQASTVPPWQRACLPLLWCDDQLVWASGIGYDVDFLASPHEAGIVPVKQWFK